MIPVGQIIEYDPDAYPLGPAVGQALGVAHGMLPNLHHVTTTTYGVFSRENDQSTEFHRAFYDGFAAHVEPIFRELVRDVIRPWYPEGGIVYQRIPTFRVHLPGNVAVGEFHKDRDYQHSPAERNYWLPLTCAWGSNTLWVESLPGAADFRPMALGYGEILHFDGANLTHGNRVNSDDWTRVSMDFRVIPWSEYEESDRVTINTGMRFAVGGYFARLE